MKQYQCPECPFKHLEAAAPRPELAPASAREAFIKYREIRVAHYAPNKPAAVGGRAFEAGWEALHGPSARHPRRQRHGRGTKTALDAEAMSD